MAVPPVFVANQVLTAAQMNEVGAWHTYSTDSPGTATTLQVNNCFSADYRHYRIYISGSSASAGNLTLQLSAAGVAATTNYAWNQVLRDYQTTPTNTVSSSGGSTSSMRIGLLNTGALGATSNIVLEVLDPEVAATTGFSAMNNYSGSVGYSLLGTHYAAASYDGFKLTGAGNLSINVQVFGMNG